MRGSEYCMGIQYYTKVTVTAKSPVICRELRRSDDLEKVQGALAFSVVNAIAKVP